MEISMNDIPKRLTILAQTLSGKKDRSIQITPETQRSIDRQIDWEHRNKGPGQIRQKGGPHQDQFTKVDHGTRRRDERSRDWSDEY